MGGSFFFGWHSDTDTYQGTVCISNTAVQGTVHSLVLSGTLVVITYHPSVIDWLRRSASGSSMNYCVILLPSHYDALDLAPA